MSKKPGKPFDKREGSGVDEVLGKARSSIDGSEEEDGLTVGR